MSDVPIIIPGIRTEANIILWTDEGRLICGTNPLKLARAFFLNLITPTLDDFSNLIYRNWTRVALKLGSSGYLRINFDWAAGTQVQNQLHVSSTCYKLPSWIGIAEPKKLYKKL